MGPRARQSGTLPNELTVSYKFRMLNIYLNIYFKCSKITDNSCSAGIHIAQLNVSSHVLWSDCQNAYR